MFKLSLFIAILAALCAVYDATEYKTAGEQQEIEVKDGEARSIYRLYFRFTYRIRTTDTTKVIKFVCRKAYRRCHFLAFYDIGQSFQSKRCSDLSSEFTFTFQSSSNDLLFWILETYINRYGFIICDLTATDPETTTAAPTTAAPTTAAPTTAAPTTADPTTADPTTAAPTTAAPTTAAPTTAAPTTTDDTTTSDPTTTAAPTTTDDTTSSECSCQFPLKRIVGGNEAKICDIPYQVALKSEFSSTPFCGGTIVAKDVIVTAAHCVTGIINNFNSIRVIVGTDTISQISGDNKKVISSIIQHHDYNSDTVDNDIALIFLNESLPFDSSLCIRRACLPTALSQDDQRLDDSVKVSGWGTLSSGGFQPNILQEVDVDIYSQVNCRRAYGTSSITDNMFCAGVTAGGKDSCQGDSGGPLVYDNGGNSELQGVVSWGNGCALASHPGVYTEVYQYVAWIKENPGKSDNCLN